MEEKKGRKCRGSVKAAVKEGDKTTSEDEKHSCKGVGARMKYCKNWTETILMEKQEKGMKRD